MQLTKEQVAELSKKRQCPRCDFDKTFGNALCRRCRSKLPPHMRLGIENIPAKDGGMVGSALRAAANYFDVHFASIRRFGGGRKR
jgi:predicted amidophosphoribosyltransferase